MINGISAVLLDANALLMPFQFQLNIDLEIERLLGPVEILVPSCVIDELDRMKSPEATAARSLANKYKIIEVQERGDKGILQAAIENCAAVITNDRELIDILKKSSVPVIRMRGRQRLDYA